MNKTGGKTATALVVANMIGSGIFTSLGFQLIETTNSWSILILWVLGAVMALFGAMSFAELGTHFNRSGGEYHFLSKIYHPLVGYLSGWVSITVGFAAPIALAAISIGKYSETYSHLPAQIVAVFVIIAISLAHSFSIKKSSRFQNITTLIKIIFILLFVIAGIYITPTHSALDWSSGWEQEVLLPAFAVSFVYVTFSYSGWNASAYIVEEIKDARKNLPRALVVGTLIVSTLYLALNFVFLKQASLAQLAGQLEVGQVVATSMFGNEGGMLISFAIALLLISSISAMVWVGSRVTHTIGEDYPLWKYFSIKNKDVPVRAIWLQAVIAILFTLTGTFEQVLVYSGFILQLFATLAVGGVLLVRQKKADNNSYKSPYFPIPQIVFIALSIWVMGYLVYARLLETAYSMISLAIGAATFYYARCTKLD